MNFMRQSNTFKLEQDLFIECAECRYFLHHEASLIMDILQTKPKVKSRNINFLTCILLLICFYHVTEDRNGISEILLQASHPL